MKDLLKKINVKQIKNVAFLAVLIGLLAYMLIDNEEEITSSNANQVVNVGIAKAEVKRDFANTPKRFNSAPTYSQGHEAAKIIHQAIDPKEAQHFVYLNISERNLILKASIAKLEAEIAENNQKKARAEKGISTLTEDNSVTSNFGMNDETPVSMGDSIVSYNSQGEALNTNQSANAIRLVGWSSKDKITASLRVGFGDKSNLEFAENIRIKQVLWGRYQIEGIDEQLKCINIYDAKVKKIIPNVCYN